MASAVTTSLAAQKFRPILLHAEVQQQPGSRVRMAYDQQVGHFKPYREHTLPMPFLSAVQQDRTSATTISDPRAPSALAPQMLELIPLLSAAARYAAHYKASAIYFGMRVGSQGDDLSQATEYVQIWNEMLQVTCGLADLEFMTPLLELDPWQVVDVGFQVAAPFDKTWSCFEELGEACWACRGCRAREAAFQQAGKADPLRIIRKV
jgi:7-cyano-7-deazaguanine synthase in queuosine biosynthesis